MMAAQSAKWRAAGAKDETLDITLDALAHLICGDKEARLAEISKAQHRHHTLTPQFFDGFELMTDDDGIVLLGNSATDQPVWPMDVCVGTNYPFEGWDAGTWQFTRVRTLDMKRWRGKLRLVTPRMVELGVMITEPSGDMRTILYPYALINGKARAAGLQLAGMRIDSVWQGIPDPAWFGAESTQHDDEMTQRMQAFAGVSLRRYYLWSVLLGEGDGPRARFVTDPLGVREAFRLRDIPPGKQRRAALLHWVKAHWRQRRRSDADKAWIKAHLRGVWSYTWNGLRCQIVPSIEDTDTATI